MPRKARVVMAGVPHHITQRGNNKMDLFYSDEDRLKYLAYIWYYCDKYDLDIWAYCLMSNHVHYIGVPQKEDAMAQVFRVAHMRYTQDHNEKTGHVGHLWQSRYFSCPLDDVHTIAAVRYVQNNPVRAGLVASPDDYMWSSCRAHLKGVEDSVLCGSSWLGVTKLIL